MRKTIRNALAAFFAGGVGLAPAPCRAYALDAQFDCKTNAHAFIVHLLHHGYIDPAPMRVEQNSVNAFRPTRDATLTAFGFKVYAVFAYEQDDALFRPGSGQPLPGSIYGVVVKAPIESVEARSQLAGSKAVAHQVIPFVLTAVACARP
ncbi:hypothetical protein [Burkholderia oklahomensis]|uniref:Uncharacterized protein n=1 Tax=Burkholderia oklahomensis TaxID=342113 RepID=A0AAI8BCS4_9BURK|nr:hypothetical protein [Burkholderia oklahomensis]AIO69866.1 hypothetical protein DM82_5678 [Burkholderia oklahomensis]AOI38956.1 hypothetical protein WG70_04540 [Burkholderia oklahomensis EO147]KUY65658.1 hypothetical protein WG70_27985 [Burkholderia oklahomensis EO147]QPS40699.1 hypothetical protein I6G57_20465 [Burkholderia oklahomensis]